MVRFLLLLGLIALTTAPVASDVEFWIAQFGVCNYEYHGSSDPFNYLGAFEGSIDDYPDAWDVVDPGYPDHAVAAIFRGDQYGPNPTYPEGGLCWDIREPYEGFYKVWMTEIVSTDEGYHFAVNYDYDPFGYPLPEGWICKLDMDGEITGENYLDLSLYECDLGHTTLWLQGIPQTGGSQMWYIIAGVPEPSLAQVIGLALGAGWVFRRIRRR